MKEVDIFVANQSRRYKETTKAYNRYFGEFRSRRLTDTWILTKLEQIRREQKDFLRDDEQALIKFPSLLHKNNYVLVARKVITDLFNKFISVLEKDLDSLQQGGTLTYNEGYETPVELDASGCLNGGLDDTYEKIDENLFDLTMNGKQGNSTRVHFEEDENEVQLEEKSFKLEKLPIPDAATVFDKKFYRKANLLITFCNMFVDKVSGGLVTVSEENGADFCDSVLGDIRDGFKKLENVHEDLIQLVHEAETDVSDVILNNEIVQPDYLSEWRKIKHDAESKCSTIKRNGSIKTERGRVPSNEYQPMKFPEIKIEKFKGELDKYLSFKQTITSLIDMYSEISEDTKLKVLSQYLADRALVCIKPARNYTRAWELLDASFGKKRNIARVYFDKIFNFSPILDKNDAESLKSFEFVLEESIAGLCAIKCPPDEFLLWSIMPKLPLVLQDRFNELHSAKDYHYISDLTNFLKDYTIVLDSREKRVGFSGTKKANNFNGKMNSQLSTGQNNSDKSAEKPKRLCFFCNESSHWSLNYCQVFKAKRAEDRFQFVKEKGFCPRCLRDHDIKKCKKNDECSFCNSKNHHSLIHVEIKKNQTKNKSNVQNSFLINESQDIGEQNEKFVENSLLVCNSKKDEDKSTEDEKMSQNQNVSELDKESLVLSLITEKKYVLLATADIDVKSKDGSLKIMRSVLDNGSQSSFITEEAAQLLRLPIYNVVEREIKGIMGISSVVKRAVTIEISSIYNNNYKLKITALVVKTITDQLPSKEFSIDHFECAKNILFADKRFNVPGSIDILLSGDILAEVVRNHLFKDPSGKLVFQSSELGYLVSGGLQTDSENIISDSVHLAISEELPKELQIKKLLDVDENAENIDENKFVENHFSSTVWRDDDGTVVVSTPLIQDISLLGDSRRKALACFLRIEKKFSDNDFFYSEYKKFMKNYLDMNHMELVDLNNKNLNFLTHHAVIRSDAVTTKLRVVFNASVKTTSGYSFNDLQPVGPKLQADIWEILLNWRFFSHVFTADIQNMYRTIRLNKTDRNLHAIIWRNSVDEPLKAYRLTTVTYGTKIAPYLAKRTLQYIAMQEREKIEANLSLTIEERNLRLEAVNILINLVYMDDIYGGGHSALHLKRIRNLVINILDSANMKLHKFASNCYGTLSDLESDKLYNGQMNFDDGLVKTLGVLFCPKKDSFGFRVKSAANKVDRISKRKILSNLCEIFDPLGFLAPINLKLKILWQDVVDTGVTWDEDVNELHLTAYNKIVSEMHLLQDIEIPRWVRYVPGKKIEIHGFCDASKRAYGAVIYMKVIDDDSSEIMFLRAKTHLFKLEDIKKDENSNLTNPRKELCAALLLAEMLETTKNALEKINVCIKNVYAYSDNQVVLYWISNKHISYPVFIQNRVMKIRKLHDFWCYIGTKENPADLASRGLMPSKILKNILWWYPPILKDNVKPERFVPSEDMINVDVPKVVSIHTLEEKYICSITDFVQKFSCYKRLVRRTIYLQKFISFIFDKNFKKEISVEDFQKAELALVRLDQRKSFPKEYKALKDGLNIPNSSKIKSLCPVLDKNHVMRVKGRLANAMLPNEEMQPMIVDHKGLLALLIMKNAHYMCLHGAKSLTVATSRGQFWITRGADIARHVISKCPKCIRFGAKTICQQMGDLPEARVLEARPFSKTGVDYAGPFTIKSMVARGKRLHKSYACIFVCMVTKAIHIELVGDLSAERFLMAYQRFTARRGNCCEIFSDNGSNFVLGKKLLDKDCQNAIKEGSELLQGFLLEQKTKWHNIPPLSPHHGGLWEAGVKSMKYHLVRVLGDTVLTFEELNTFLIRIEACLNSRPLAALSNDPNSFLLTPGHFLIGDSLVAPPKPLQKHLLSLKGEKLISRKVQEAWVAWRQDVLKSMMIRKKWQNTKENVTEGDIVILKDEQTPPTVWPLARVSKVHTGKDNNVRVVSVETNNKEYIRPITKIIPVVKKQTLSEVNDTNPSSTIVTRSKTKTIKNCTKNLIIQGLIMLLLIPMILGNSPYNIEKFKKNENVLFEKIKEVRITNGQWNIFSYVQLSSYLNAKNKMTNISEQAKISCDMIKDRYGDNSCENIIVDFSRKINAFEAKENLIEEFHARKKRQIGIGIGFGIGMLVDSFLHGSNDELETQIKDLTSNQEKLIALQRNNTSILENSISFINENEEKLNEETKLLANQLYEVERHIRHNEFYVQFMRYCIQFMISFGNIEVQQNSIIKLMYAKDHKMNTGIITFTTFNKVIDNIKKERNIQMDVNIKELYINADISARVTKNFIIFRIKVPLLIDQKYELLKIIPIPFYNKNEKYYKIKLNYDMIAYNYNDSNYFVKDIFENCYELNSVFICKFINQRRRPCCESMLIAGVVREDCIIEECSKDYNEFIKRDAQNKWIFHIVNQTRVQINCTTTFYDVMLEPQVGQLELQDDCVLTDRDWIIIAHKEVNTTVDNVFIPISNSSWLNNFPFLGNITFEKPKQIKDLRFLMKQLEEENSISFEKVITHPYTQVSLWVGFVLLVCLVSFALIYYRYVHHVRQCKKGVDVLEVMRRIDLAEQPIHMLNLEDQPVHM